MHRHAWIEDAKMPWMNHGGYRIYVQKFWRRVGSLFQDCNAEGAMGFECIQQAERQEEAVGMLSYRCRAHFLMGCPLRRTETVKFSFIIMFLQL